MNGIPINAPNTRMQPICSAVLRKRLMRNVRRRPKPRWATGGVKRLRLPLPYPSGHAQPLDEELVGWVELEDPSRSRRDKEASQNTGSCVPARPVRDTTGVVGQQAVLPRLAERGTATKGRVRRDYRRLLPREHADGGRPPDGIPRRLPRQSKPGIAKGRPRAGAGYAIPAQGACTVYSGGASAAGSGG
jgi:hypothetical protein